MKSYMDHAEYQDLTKAVEKAHETLENIKLETKTAEHNLKFAKKEDSSKFEISKLHLELRRQKLAEDSQKVMQKIAELERENWVASFKKSEKKIANEEKEAAKVVAEAAKKAERKTSKKILKVTQNGENLNIETVAEELPKVKQTRTRKPKMVIVENLESTVIESTNAPDEIPKVEKVKQIRKNKTK